MNKFFYKNHLINKKLGQNFLIDTDTINNIINAIHPKKKDIIIEIGPGFGALTTKIIKFINQLTIIEIDKNLSNILKKHFSNTKKIKFLEKNVIKVDFYTLSKKIGHPLRIIGNLPYNFSIKIIFHLLKYSNIIYDMHFMIQKEVAQRFVATPNNKKYGKLSILLQYYCKIITLFDVHACSFIPKPKVNSTIIKLIPYQRNNNPYPITNIKTLNIITNIAFNQRRKTIKNSLKKIFTPKELKNHGIDLESRAENISIEKYCDLTNSIKNSIILNKNFDD